MKKILGILLSVMLLTSTVFVSACNGKTNQAYTGNVSSDLSNDNNQSPEENSTENSNNGSNSTDNDKDESNENNTPSNVNKEYWTPEY